MNEYRIVATVTFDNGKFQSYYSVWDSLKDLSGLTVKDIEDTLTNGISEAYRTGNGQLSMIGDSGERMVINLGRTYDVVFKIETR